MFRFETIPVERISQDMLLHFHHRQTIRQKYVKINGEWEIRNTDALRTWSEEKRIWITGYLREQIARGGSLAGAFCGDALVGFCCVDGHLYGETAKYANLTMLFVDDAFKRNGIGKALFDAACRYALSNGADKLFISAVPSVETIAFYFSMGCVDAREIVEDYIDTTEDRYLEYTLR